MAIRGGPDIIEDGLVLHLDAADRNSYPLSGSTIYDLSGNGNNGTLQGNASYSSTYSGSIVFDGSGDYITTTFGSGRNVYNNPISISLWVKSTTGTEMMYFSTGQTRNVNDLNQRLYVGLRTGSYYDFGIRSSPWSSPANPANTNWNLITLTINSTGAKLYLNTTQTLTKSVNSTYVLNDNVWVGCHNSGTDLPLNGSTGPFQIYTKALSADEIRQNYNATKGRFGL